MNARRALHALVIAATLALLAGCAAPVHPEPWDAVAAGGRGLGVSPIEDPLPAPAA